MGRNSTGMGDLPGSPGVAPMHFCSLLPHVYFYFDLSLCIFKFGRVRKGTHTKIALKSTHLYHNFRDQMRMIWYATSYRLPHPKYCYKSYFERGNLWNLCLSYLVSPFMAFFTQGNPPWCLERCPKCPNMPKIPSYCLQIHGHSPPKAPFKLHRCMWLLIPSLACTQFTLQV